MSLRKRVDALLKGFEKEFSTHNRIEVSKSALIHNLDVFRSVSGKPVIPVLKGNAYGHGIDVVAYALKDQELSYIAVDGYFEALRIREVSNQPVLVMGAIKPANFAHMKYDKFAFVVHDEAAIKALGQTGKKIKVHLECNTGMNRMGAKPEDVAALAQLILTYKNLELEGVMSHLADSDGADPVTVQLADDKFDTCIEAIRRAGGKPRIIHIAQTAGSVKSMSKYANSVRLGIGLYGINPFPFQHPLHRRLRALHPAMRLVSTVTQVLELDKGDQVSYNYTFTAPRRMKVGVLPLGYYEGLNRSLSNAGVVKFGEKCLPVVGRVCMNHTMIGIGASTVNEGDEIIVYSNYSDDKNGIDRVAAEHGLFNYNLLTALSHDLRRLLVP
jgi:alanine racemase